MIPEVSPCGYPVDLLRSCYETDARFYRDDPRTSRIRWFRVPADRPFLPVPTLFASSVYGQHNEFRQPVGEVGQGEQLMSERPWRNGRDASLTRWVEGHYCGTEAQWRGELYTPPTPPLDGDCCLHGVPLCLDTFPTGRPRYMIAPGFSAVGLLYGVPNLGPAGLPPRPRLPYTGDKPFCSWEDHVEFNVYSVQVGNPDAHHTTYVFGYGSSPGGPSFSYAITLPVRSWEWFPDVPLVLPLLGQSPDWPGAWELPATVTLFGRGDDFA